MKSFISTLVFLLGLGTLPLEAQSAPSPTPQPRGERSSRRDRLEWLPTELRDGYRKIRDEVRQDPRIKELEAKAEAARRELREATQAAMERRDPEMARKVRTHVDTQRRQREAQRAQPVASPAPQSTPVIPVVNLTRLEQARRIARQAPGVQAAEAAVRAASSSEDKQNATQAYELALRTAILIADPTLADELPKEAKPKFP